MRDRSDSLADRLARWLSPGPALGYPLPVPRPLKERPPRVPQPVLGPGLAHRLRTSRIARGWSQSDLEAASGVSQQTICGLEKDGAGGGTTINTVACLAEALGVPAGWLAFGG